MSGINVYLQLQGCKDVIAEPFVLGRSMRADRERRQALMQRRNYLMQLGLDQVGSQGAMSATHALPADLSLFLSELSMMPVFV
eukprot:scaffold340104_cov19-Prasinocladus_malaysianus.AAC.1